MLCGGLQICKTILSMKHILLECPISITKKKIFRKMDDFNDCNNIRDILYNTDIIISVVKLVVHSPVGKLV